MLYLWSFWDLSYSDTVTVGFDDKRNVMEAIIVVKIVLSCAFFFCNTHDALSAHASCTSLYVCMDVLFSADSWSCAWFKSGRCITLPATMEKKCISVFMLLRNISAAKYVWICTQTLFVYILLKCFKTCHTLCRTFSYDSRIT